MQRIVYILHYDINLCYNTDMKKGILTFSIGMALLFFQQFSFVAASELTDDYFDIANNYFNSNNYARALDYLDDILKIEPDNAKAKELKIKVLPLCNPVTPLESSNEASSATKVLNAKTPNNFVVLNVPQADVEKMNYNSDYYNTKGQELYKQKDYNAAIEYFYKALKLNPKNSQAYNNLAMCYWLKNNSTLAIKYFKKAHYSNKNYTQPLVNLALLYKQLKDEKKEVYYLQKAIQFNTNDYWAYYLLGEYYKSKSQYAKAIAYYKEVVKINEKFPQVYLGLGMSFFETEEFNYALMALNQYKELNPTSDLAYFLVARTDLVLCRYQDAKENIEKAIELNSTPEYQYELGKVDYYLEDYQHALDIFQNLTKTSDSAEIFNYTGLCNYKLKNIDQAIANFKRAIDLDGLRPIYYYNLGQCYKSMGDKKTYSDYVSSATKITPINYQDFIDLSYIYCDNGNPNYAINTLNSAISKYPTVKALYLSKLKIYESIGDNLHYNETKNIINERFNTK